MGPCKKYTVYRNTQPMFTRQLYKKQQEPGGICAGFLLWAKNNTFAGVTLFDACENSKNFEPQFGFAFVFRVYAPLSCSVYRSTLDLDGRLSSTPLKEVIQPHLPIRLPCYDFTPVISLTFDNSFLAVRSLASGTPDSHGVTGGVYKTRERIHPDMLIRDY